MRLLQRLFRDQSGAIISTEFVAVLSLMLVAALLGIFLVRTATLKVFMGVAQDVASEETHVFDAADTDLDDDGGDFHFGYQRAATPNTFDSDLPNLGITPMEITPAPAQHEGNP